MRIGKQPKVTPITDLQEMLRMIYPKSPLSKDGLYGEKTKAAVEQFQKDYTLPITGSADQETYDAVVREYEKALILQDQAEPLRIILQPNQVIERNSENIHLYLLQGMLIAISRYYVEMPVARSTGILDEDTAKALSFFQSLSDLPVTGELDKNTWRHLSKHYRSVVGDGSGSYPARIAQK